MKKALLTVSIVVLPLLSTMLAQAFVANTPKPGVYGCFGQRFAIYPSFGLADPNTYVDADGKRGSYVYDASTGILTMTSGSLSGTKYKRTHEATFRLLQPNGEVTACQCVLEPKKDINKRPW